MSGLLAPSSCAGGGAESEGLVVENGRRRSVGGTTRSGLVGVTLAAGETERSERVHSWVGIIGGMMDGFKAYRRARGSLGIFFGGPSSLVLLFLASEGLTR